MKIVCPVNIFPSRNSETVEKKLWRLRVNQKPDFNKNWDMDCIIDKRLHDSLPRTIATYKGLKSSLLRCDGFLVNCDVDIRLVNTVQTCAAIPLKTIIYTKKKVSDFEALMFTVHHVRQKTLSANFWTNIFLPVVNEKSSMLCRFLLTVISEQETHEWQECRVYLMSGLSYAMANQDKDTSKTIAWFITKMFFVSLSNNVHKHIIDIWPASRCDCLDLTQPLCFKQIVIIVEMNGFCSEVPNMFWEIEVKCSRNDSINNFECSKIHEHLQNSSNRRFQSEISISGEEAKLLFNEHTNLSLIGKSPYKSTGFRKNNHGIIEHSCVQLYCKKKGFIPIGENHFPKTVNGMNTDILEGSPRLLSNLKVGDKIGIDGYRTGTLGGFVKVRGDKAFLTCTHVLMNSDELNADQISLDDDHTVWVNVYRENTSTCCGKVRDIAFNMDNERETSIDAALVEIKEDVNVEATDYISLTAGKLSFSDLGMRSVYLNDNCVDYRPLCFSMPTPILSTVSVAAVSGFSNSTASHVFENREKNIDFKSIQDIYSSAIIECIKENVRHAIQSLQSTHIPEPLTEYIILNNCRPDISPTIQSVVVRVIKKVYQQSQSNFVVDLDKELNELKTDEIESCIIGDVHMQKTFLKHSAMHMSTRRNYRRCYNQVYFSNVRFQEGDSGTCIYVLSPVRGCIGMAIASHPQGGCIATPIMDILNHFNIRIK